MQINHVLTEAHEHLRSGLPVDASVDVRLARERVRQLPVVGDGVAENTTRFSFALGGASAASASR